MNAITQKPATAGQIEQISRFGADAIEEVLNEMKLEQSIAKRIIESGDGFAYAIRLAAFDSLKILSVKKEYRIWSASTIWR